MEESIDSKINSSASKVLIAIKEYLSNPTLSLISSPRPWVSDFLSISKFSKPHKEEIFNRAKENLAFYLPNYLIILLTFLVLGVLSIPNYIICLMFLGGLWAYLYSIKTLMLSGKEITAFHKNLAISIAALLVTIVFAWEIVFYTCIFVSAGSMLHSTFHSVPEKYGTYAPPEIPV